MTRIARDGYQPKRKPGEPADEDLRPPSSPSPIRAQHYRLLSFPGGVDTELVKLIARLYVEGKLKS